MEDLNRKLESAVASVEVEGFTVRDEIKKLVLKEAKGEINFKQFSLEIDRLIKNV